MVVNILLNSLCLPVFRVQLAFKYLSWLLYPLLVCYAIYSILYLEHRGWYSWVLSMLYGFLLTFGKQLKRDMAHSSVLNFRKICVNIICNNLE